MVREGDFEYREGPIPEPAAGQALVRAEFISVDPSMRGQMENRADYVAPLSLGDVMRAGAVGRVVESHRAELPVGALVSGAFGMQDYALVSATGWRAYDADLDPRLALGVLGNTGMTAYFGMLDIGTPKSGDTVVVSGAAGATGSVAGQIARIQGCRVIGIAGSPTKCEWLTGKLGFDAAIDYRAHDVAAELDRLCPDGIDVYFDNVGGAHLEAAIATMSDFGRVVACGSISTYNDVQPEPGPSNLFQVVTKRLSILGFIVTDHGARQPAFASEMAGWVADGRVRWRETVVDGLDAAPDAFIGLFRGENVGKMLVRLAD
jgi:NADPH-dependent curcumin reductase CurA